LTTKLSSFFVDWKDIKLNVIRVSNGQLQESEEIYRGLLYGHKDSTNIENLLSLTMLPRKSSRST
jgi:hypothetical protein